MLKVIETSSNLFIIDTTFVNLPRNQSEIKIMKLNEENLNLIKHLT